MVASPPSLFMTASAEYFNVIKLDRVTIFMTACLLCSDFVLKLSEVSYAEVLGNKSSIHIRVTLE